MNRSRWMFPIELKAASKYGYICSYTIFNTIGTKFWFYIWMWVWTSTSTSMFFLWKLRYLGLNLDPTDRFWHMNRGFRDKPWSFDRLWLVYSWWISLIHPDTSCIRILVQDSHSEIVSSYAKSRRGIGAMFSTPEDDRWNPYWPTTRICWRCCVMFPLINPPWLGNLLDICAVFFWWLDWIHGEKSCYVSGNTLTLIEIQRPKAMSRAPSFLALRSPHAASLGRSEAWHKMTPIDVVYTQNSIYMCVD